MIVKSELDKETQKMSKSLRKKIDRKSLMAEFLASKRNKREAQPRSMSSEIMTRWYRSPEACLTEKIYDQSADVWSLGIILSEMLYCSDVHSKNHGFDNSRRFLFKGSSSFPLSPSKAENEDFISENDQLAKILRIYPELSSDDLVFLSE